MDEMAPVYATDRALLSEMDRRGLRDRSSLHHSGVFVDARYSQNSTGEQGAFTDGVASNMRSPGQQSSDQQRQRQGRLSMPLPLTLEAVENRSLNPNLPSWAQRASEKPLIKGTSDMVKALVRADSTNEVLRVLFERAEGDSPSVQALPKSATTMIEQIRKEAFKIESQITQSFVEQTKVAESRLSDVKEGRKLGLRNTKTSLPKASNINNSTVLTGLKPLSTATVTQVDPSEAKLQKLTKQLEDLVWIAENQSRDAARLGVRMAEDSSEAIDEGHAAPIDGARRRDEKVDLDALERDVFEAVQEMLNMRRFLRLDNEDDFDGGW